MKTSTSPSFFRPRHALSLLCFGALCACSSAPPQAPTWEQCVHLGFAPPTQTASSPQSPRQEESFESTQDTPLEAATSEKEPQAQPKATPKEDPPSPPRRFLVIGDSQVQHSFGFALDYLLRHGIQDAEIMTYAVCASHPISWVAGSKHNCGFMQRGEDFKALPDARGPGFNGVTLGRNRTPKLLELLHTHRPDVVLIALGENGKKSSKKHVRRSVHSLARTVDCYKRGVRDETACGYYIKHGEFPEELERTQPVSEDTAMIPRSLSCLWVMPPYTRYDKDPSWLQSYYDLFAHEIDTSCTMIDSRPLTCTEGLKDASVVCGRDAEHGIHFGRARARLWSVAVFDRMRTLLDLTNALPEERDRIARDWNLGPQPTPMQPETESAAP